MEPMESSPAAVRHQSSSSSSSSTSTGTSGEGPLKTLETLNFDNRALRSLPIDPVHENFPRKVRTAAA
jgi:hypothetical protein